MTTYKLIKSPKSEKKFRIITPSGKTVDFGAKGYSDYTLHKNPFRMRLYVTRHGGKVSKTLKKELNPKKLNKEMLSVTNSTKENWSSNGLETAGFWSRWLLWSKPSLNDAKKLIEKKFSIKIT